MKLTLKNAAQYVKSSRAPAALLSILKTFRIIFTFTQERSNRLARFIKIIKAYKLGKPIRDIEAEYECSRSTILRYARLVGLPKRPKHLDLDIRNAVIKQYKEGKPIAEIARKHNVSQAYVSKTATEEKINRKRSKSR